MLCLSYYTHMCVCAWQREGLIKVQRHERIALWPTPTLYTIILPNSKCALCPTLYDVNDVGKTAATFCNYQCRNTHTIKQRKSYMKVCRFAERVERHLRLLTQVLSFNPFITFNIYSCLTFPVKKSVFSIILLWLKRYHKHTSHLKKKMISDWCR